MNNYSTHIIEKSDALIGRPDPIPRDQSLHFVNGHTITPPFPETFLTTLFGMGCFWGAERVFWESEGVYSTAVGFASGLTPHPTYNEVCTGKTGHNEVVRVCFDPSKISYQDLLSIFFENHDPTQGMQQGNDRGTQYRSGIYPSTAEEKESAENFRTAYQKELSNEGFSLITTEIVMSPIFYYAEDFHQQYLAKNPTGYCGIGGTGVACPSGLF